MADIMFSYPEHCGENDCPVGWHLYHVWINDNGKYSASDSDGDHTDLTRKEYNELWKQHDAMWLAYAEDVLETGNDVLDNYLAFPRLKQQQIWAVEFADVAGGGLEIVRVKRGRWMGVDEAPEEVRQYLNVKEFGASRLCGDFTSVADLREAVSDVLVLPKSGLARVTFDLPVYRDNPRYQQQLKRIVKRDIARLKKATAGAKP